MERKVRVLHQDPNGAGYTAVFEWKTNKKGMTNDVIMYLIEKFQHSTKYPAGYQSRPITTGDRLELMLTEGPLAGSISVFEMVSPHSFRQL